MQTMVGGMGPLRGDYSRLWRQVWPVVVAWMFVFSSGGTGVAEKVCSCFFSFFFGAFASRSEASDSGICFCESFVPSASRC